MRQAAGHITERKVTLLERWLKGLTAAQGYLARWMRSWRSAAPDPATGAPTLRKVSAALLAS